MELQKFILLFLGAIQLVTSNDQKYPVFNSIDYIREHDFENFVNYVTNNFDVKRTYFQVQILKGKQYLYEGKFSLAERHFKNVLDKYSKHDEALDLLGKIDHYHSLVDAAKTFAEEFGDLSKAIDMATYAIEISPASKEAYDLRAKLYNRYRGQYLAANDLGLSQISNIIQTNDTEQFAQLSYLLFQREYPKEAVNLMERCLDVNPQNKKCSSYYDMFRKYFKQITESQKALEERRYKNCIEGANELLKFKDVWNFRARCLLCECHTRDNQPSEAIYFCSQILQYKHDVEAYSNRAEALLQSWLSSINSFRFNVGYAQQDYAKALDIDPAFRRALDGQAAAERLKYLQTIIYVLGLGFAMLLYIHFEKFFSKKQD